MSGARTARELIDNALRAAAARQGVRVKVRFPRALLARANACAADVDEALGDWVNSACRSWRAGKFSGVAKPEKSKLATRSGSVPVTVRAPEGMPGAEVKAAVEACCAYCEARRIVYTPQKVGAYFFEDGDGNVAERRA